MSIELAISLTFFVLLILVAIIFGLIATRQKWSVGKVQKIATILAAVMILIGACGFMRLPLWYGLIFAVIWAALFPGYMKGINEAGQNIRQSLLNKKEHKNEANVTGKADE